MAMGWKGYAVTAASSIVVATASYAYCLVEVYRAEAVSARAELAYLRTWKKAHDESLGRLVALEHDTAYWVWVVGELEREREGEEAIPRLTPPDLAPRPGTNTS
jgi:hypothetical protein